MPLRLLTVGVFVFDLPVFTPFFDFDISSSYLLLSVLGTTILHARERDVAGS
jgi:hypothetical protein